MAPPRSPTSSTRHEPKPSRKERAAKTVDAALRGGILAGAVAAIAWLLAVALGGTIFFLLIVATVLALIYTVVRGDKARLAIWGLIAIAWALVLAERWVVNDNGGLIVAGAAYARRRARRPPRGHRQEVAGASCSTR